MVYRAAVSSILYLCLGSELEAIRTATLTTYYTSRLSYQSPTGPSNPMHPFSSMLIPLVSLILIFHSNASTGKYTPPKHLRVTALISTPHNTSALQCWEIASPFVSDSLAYLRPPTNSRTRAPFHRARKVPLAHHPVPSITSLPELTTPTRSPPQPQAHPAPPTWPSLSSRTQHTRSSHPASTAVCTMPRTLNSSCY